MLSRIEHVEQSSIGYSMTITTAFRATCQGTEVDYTEALWRMQQFASKCRLGAASGQCRNSAGHAHLTHMGCERERLSIATQGENIRPNLLLGVVR